MNESAIPCSVWVALGLTPYWKGVFSNKIKMIKVMEDLCQLYKVDTTFILNTKARSGQDVSVRYLIIFLLFITTDVTYEETAALFNYTTMAGAYGAVQAGASRFKFAKQKAAIAKQYAYYNGMKVHNSKRALKIGKLFITEMDNYII